MYSIFRITYKKICHNKIMEKNKNSIITKISLIAFLASLSLLVLDLLVFLNDLSTRTKLLPDWLGSYLGLICVVSFFIVLFTTMGRERRKANAPIDSVYTFNIKELNDENFHNDFNKVPGGTEIGVTNIPAPPNHSIENKIVNGHSDPVLEDLAKIGIIDTPNKKE